MFVTAYIAMVLFCIMLAALVDKYAKVFALIGNVIMIMLYILTALWVGIACHTIIVQLI